MKISNLKRAVLLPTSQFVPRTSIQPFFTTKPTWQGTGLGLSLSYDIVKAHGGEFKAESKEGEGSEFVIILPTQNYNAFKPPGVETPGYKMCTSLRLLIVAE